MNALDRHALTSTFAHGGQACTADQTV